MERSRKGALIPVTACGRHIEHHHHNATISDAIIKQIRDRHEDDGWGYKQISAEFGLALTTVRKICTYERRGQIAARWKEKKNG